MLLSACNPDKEQVAPTAGPGVQNGVPINPSPVPVLDTPVAMYTANAAYIPNYTGLPPATATPGNTVYFSVLTAGYIPTGIGQATILPDEADLVTVFISGTTDTGAPLSMLAERATLMDENSCGYALGYAVPYIGMPNYGTYVQSYRFVAWKVPPFMPAGYYQVTLSAFQTNGNIPRYFTAARRTQAVGILRVNASAGMLNNTLQYSSNQVPPTVANPIFGITWPASQFIGGTKLRTTVRNIVTGRYYCLSPGAFYPPYNTGPLLTCSGLPASWDASALVPNTGTEAIRYNSTSLVAGQSPGAIPAGNYQVYLDALDGTSLTKYLTTAPTTPPINLP